MAYLLRHPDPKPMTYLLLDMLRIFIISEHREYQRNLTLHLLCLIHGSSTLTPFWNFFKVAQPALNEDLCERELSSLARAVSNDTTGGSIEFCDKQFKLGSFVRNILGRWENSRVTDERNTKWNGDKIDIRTNDPDLELVRHFFLVKIRQLSSPQQFVSYTGNPTTWTTGVKAQQGSKHILRKELLVETAGCLDDLLLKVKKLIENPFEREIKHWSNELQPQEVKEEVKEEDDIDMADVDFLLQVPIVPPPAQESVLIDEPVENDEPMRFMEDEKKSHVPQFLRETVVPDSPLLPIAQGSNDRKVATLALKRTAKAPRRPRTMPSKKRVNVVPSQETVSTNRIIDTSSTENTLNDNITQRSGESEVASDDRTTQGDSNTTKKRKRSSRSTVTRCCYGEWDSDVEAFISD